MQLLTALQSPYPLGMQLCSKNKNKSKKQQQQNKHLPSLCKFHWEEGNFARCSDFQAFLMVILYCIKACAASGMCAQLSSYVNLTTLPHFSRPCPPFHCLQLYTGSDRKPDGACEQDFPFSIQCESDSCLLISLLRSDLQAFLFGIILFFATKAAFQVILLWGVVIADCA